MISPLFGFMVALVAAAALGRQVFDELGRIRAGERPTTRSAASGTRSSARLAPAGNCFR
jgi:hypothetical protein